MKMFSLFTIVYPEGIKYNSNMCSAVNELSSMEIMLSRGKAIHVLTIACLNTFEYRYIETKK